MTNDITVDSDQAERYETAYKRVQMLRKEHEIEFDKINSLLKLFECDLEAGMVICMNAPYTDYGLYKIITNERTGSKRIRTPAKHMFKTMDEMCEFAHRTMSEKNC